MKSHEGVAQIQTIQIPQKFEKLLQKTAICSAEVTRILLLYLNMLTSMFSFDS